MLKYSKLCIYPVGPTALCKFKCVRKLRICRVRARFNTVTSKLQSWVCKSITILLAFFFFLLYSLSVGNFFLHPHLLLAFFSFSRISPILLRNLVPNVPKVSSKISNSRVFATLLIICVYFINLSSQSILST